MSRMNKNLVELPDNSSYYFLLDSGLSVEEQRNVLLNFLEDRNLSKPFIKFLNKHFSLQSEFED